MERSTRLVGFLMQDLGVSSEAVAIALRFANSSLGPLHLILWQLGLLSTQQLNLVFDWLEGQSVL